MIVNNGIVDTQIGFGGHLSHQGWIDCAPGDQCPHFPGAACFKPVGVSLFTAVDSDRRVSGRFS